MIKDFGRNQPKLIAEKTKLPTISIARSAIFLVSKVFLCKILNTQKLKITDPYLKSSWHNLELSSAVGIVFVFRLQYGNPIFAAVIWIIKYSLPSQLPLVHR